MNDYLRLTDNTFQEQEFSSFSGRIVEVLPKPHDQNIWYRCEARGTVTTNNQDYKNYLKRHKIYFTIQTTKTLQKMDYVTVIGKANYWVSPTQFKVFSLDGAFVVDGQFTYQTLSDMLEGVGDNYKPIEGLTDLLNTYKEAKYKAEEALIDIGYGEDSPFVRETSADTQVALQQALRADTNNISRNLVISELYPYFGRNNQFAERMYEIYGFDALKELKRNPWELWFTIPYMTLEKCDEIARILNLDVETDSRRRTAIVRHAMQSTLDNLGYTYLPKNMATALYEENFQDLMEFDEYIYHLTQTEEIFEIPQGYQAKPLYYGENKIIRGVDNLLQRHFHPTSKPKSRIGTLKLTDEQYDAVCQSLHNGLFILTGGPGVGKTTTLKAIIQAHIDEYRLTADNIVLMAPTGKAAQRMMEQTGLPATTIHKKLVLSPGKSFVKDDVIIANRRTKLFIIDESSMMDTEIAGAVFELARQVKDCKLILVGDSNQLPSIGPGQVLKDLLDKNIPHVNLTKIQRQAEDSAIIELAHLVQNGEFPGQEWFDQRPNVYFADATTVNVIKTIQDRVLAPKLGQLQDVQIITPYRNQTKRATTTGIADADTVSYINHYTQRFFVIDQDQDFLDDNYGPRGVGRIFRVGDRVICKKNVTETVVNGSVGVITKIDAEHKNPMLDSITVKFDDCEMAFSRMDESLYYIDLAYAITVHQSQGSEYETVIIPMVRPAGYNEGFLNRNILYTALTRAKTNLIFLGSVVNYAKIASTPAPSRITRLQEEIESQ